MTGHVRPSSGSTRRVPCCAVARCAISIARFRRATRTLDEGRSVVAGWRGQYCPVASPDGAEGLTGQERCDALAAIFVDQLRIDRRTHAQTRLYEALETERQTILKARITRNDRNDLLELLRLRTEAVEESRRPPALYHAA